MNSKQLLISLFTLLLMVFGQSAFALECQNNMYEGDRVDCGYGVASKSYYEASNLVNGGAYCGFSHWSDNSSTTFTLHGILCSSGNSNPRSFCSKYSGGGDCECAPGQNRVGDWCSDPVPFPEDDNWIDNESCADSWDLAAGDCGDTPATCEAGGGAFGWVDGNPVCIPQGGDSGPVCNENGFNCNTPIPSDSDSGSGAVDPDAGSGVPGTDSSDTATNDNAPGTGNNKIGTDTNSGAACDPATDGPTCIPNDVNGDGKCDPATEPNCLAGGDKAEGTCDPNEPGYALCIGQLQDADGADDYINSENARYRDNAIDKIDQAGKDFMGSANPISEDGDYLSDLAASVFPSGSGCAPLGWTYGGMTFDLDCDVSARIKGILGYVFYFYTLLGIVGIFLNSSGSKV